MLLRYRTIALWVILIILFVAFYQIFRGPPPGASAPPAPAPARFDVTAVLARWVPVIFLVLFVAFYAFARKRNLAMHEGVRLLGQGRYLRALELFEAQRSQANPVATYNCGVSRLQLWKIEAALVDFEAAKKQQAAQKVAALVTLIPEHLALTHALLGREGDARTALAELATQQGDPGRIALATAILLARAGDWSGARARLGTLEVKHMSGTIGALARTIDAWCIEQLTRERRHLDRVVLFGEASPDELKRHWPELIAFVERTPAW